ncbi:MAG: TIGR02530 family flagellar biosynthesis protein [Bdellovibrionota bacterium]
MDIRKLNNLNVPTTEGPSGGTKTPGGLSDKGGTSFKDTLAQLGNLGTPQGIAGNPAAKGLGTAASPAAVKFSNHAIERMQTRGIKYSQDDIAKIGQAIGKAAAKGSKDSLILMNDSALIVSVKNNTVVTVMDKAALKENVFTNIDSTIVM